RGRHGRLRRHKGPGGHIATPIRGRKEVPDRTHTRAGRGQSKYEKPPHANQEIRRGHMKRTTGSLGLRALGLTGCLIMLGWLSPGPGSTAVQKVDVCHREGNGSFHLITVASQAVQAHRTHGDTLPGEAVPGTPGYVFDETCMEEPASTCPCDFSVGALANE